MIIGIVKRFNKIKGYGFIEVANSEPEIFVHYSEIELAGYKELKVGQQISFEQSEGEKGLFATKVKIISKS